MRLQFARGGIERLRKFTEKFRGAALDFGGELVLEETAQTGQLFVEALADLSKFVHE